MIKYNNFLPLVILLVSFSNCIREKNAVDEFIIINEAISDSASPFYIDIDNYPANRRTLPIGIFDSGTGGLTVLNSILEQDSYNNESYSSGADGIADFATERFIYLADEANMPYGKYDSEGKSAFLKELVIKDALFLLDNEIYSSPEDTEASDGKEPVKAIVIACNTATAYGFETLQEAISDMGLDIPVMGIIDAGSKDALMSLKESGENKTIIGVMATEGTCSSEGYPNSIMRYKDEILGVKEISIVQQAGVGLAGAIDGDGNYIDLSALSTRDSDLYKGPGLNKDYPVDTTLWLEYDFSGGSELFVDKDNEGRIKTIQLNSVSNYIKYAVTELVMEGISEGGTGKIGTVILGCTHYPFFEKEIRGHFSHLRSLGGQFSEIIADSIILIDPANSLADELFTSMKKQDLWGENEMLESEFYISTPNTLLKENKIDQNGEFPFEYKYGREINTGDRFVKIVPFSDRWIKPEIKERIKENIPVTYNIIYKGK